MIFLASSSGCYPPSILKPQAFVTLTQRVLRDLCFVGVSAFQILVELRFLGRVSFACNHGLENGHEKAPVTVERGAVVRLHGLRNGTLRGGGNKLEAADKDAHSFRGRRLNTQRQD